MQQPPLFNSIETQQTFHLSSIECNNICAFFQNLDEHKASIVPFQPCQGRFGLFRRAPTLKFPEAEQLRDEVFLIAKVRRRFMYGKKITASQIPSSSIHYG